MKSLAWLVLAACAHAAPPAPPTTPSPQTAEYTLPRPIDPADIRSIDIKYTLSGWIHDEQRYHLARDPHGSFPHLAEADLAALLAAITDLDPSSGTLRCVGKTDWYPSFWIELHGARDVELVTTANCLGFAPWNVVIDGDLFAQYNGKLGPVVQALLARIDPVGWTGFATDPIESPGAGELWLTSDQPAPYGARRVAPPRSQRDAGVLASSEPVRAWFGDAPPTDVYLICNQLVDPRCERVTAFFEARRGTFTVDAVLAGGRLESIAFDAEVVRQLDALLASPSYRALRGGRGMDVEIRLQRECPEADADAFAAIQRAVHAPADARCDVYILDASPAGEGVRYFPALGRLWIEPIRGPPRIVPL